jgi:hypothetical protein
VKGIVVKVINVIKIKMSCVVSRIQQHLQANTGTTIEVKDGFHIISKILCLSAYVYMIS